MNDNNNNVNSILLLMEKRCEVKLFVLFVVMLYCCKVLKVKLNSLQRIQKRRYAFKNVVSVCEAYFVYAIWF